MIVSLLLGAVAVAAVPTVVARDSSSSPVAVSSTVPDTAGAAILHPFVSYSIEFAFFPDFAGNNSQPNTFSNQLLDNLANLQGVKPYIRVGGNTQDFALYDPNLKTATNGTIVPARSTDYPYILYIGKSYFESYSTWPNTKFIHGFNLGKNGSAAMTSLLETVPLACQALQNGKLAYWELGNEPDLYSYNGQFAFRPSNWSEPEYVQEWLQKERAIKQKLGESCPQMATDAMYQFIAPSCAGIYTGLNATKVWQSGLDDDRDIALNSMHNYINGATSPGVTLQYTLMNHSTTVQSVQQHVALQHNLAADNLAQGLPYILGETNSLYNEGKPGLSNAFGAALWGVDFNLYSASQNIRRIHMHQGTDYRYAAWQPIQTSKTTIGTKPPYYGSVMVAAMLAGSSNNTQNDQVQVVNLPLQQETEAAYAAYVNGHLTRIAVINLQEYNYTTPASSHSRPTAKYSFQLPQNAPQSLGVQRLMANGSNAISGITWDGWSYNYDLKQGQPVRLQNVTVGETVPVSQKGVVEVEVPWSSGVILNFE